MKFIMRKDISTLEVGEHAVCLESMTLVKHTEFEGIIEQSLKNINELPKAFLTEAVSFFNKLNDFIPVYFTVTFKLGNGEADILVEVLEGGKAPAMDTPLREGYDFLGWFVGANEFNFNRQITEDIEVVASWEEIVTEPEEPIEE